MRQVATALLTICFILSISSCTKSGGGSTKQSQSSVYDQVVGGGKLRCGYVVYPPACIKDPNTGELSGIAIEALREAAKNLGIELEWTEEVGWGSMIEGLRTGRYDIIGSGIWPNSQRAKLVAFTRPLYFSGICVYTRPGDSRFTKSLSAINSPEIKIATIDGETADFLARSRFPKAERESLPQLSDVSQMLLNVVDKKADVAFAEPYVGMNFLKSNPGTLVNINPDKPIATFGNCMVLPLGETKLKSMLDTALDELVNSGYIDLLIDKYEGEPGALYRVALPYRQPETE